MTYPASYHRALATLATDEQWNYVRRLAREAFAHGFASGIDEHHRPTYYTKQQANADIDRLKAAKAAGWK